jgi:hypothetical protein
LPKKLGPELILVPLRMLLSLGEIILFSPNFWGVDDALKAVGPLKGKTVVDVTNPLEWNPNDRLVRSLPWSTTAAEELAKKLPDAQVVKAFSTIPASFIPHALFRPGFLIFYLCSGLRLGKPLRHSPFQVAAIASVRDPQSKRETGYGKQCAHCCTGGSTHSRFGRIIFFYDLVILEQRNRPSSRFVS